jgi:acyl carrier protein
MGDAAIWERVKELLSFHSGAPPSGITPASSPQNTPGWDSVANLDLMCAIEDEYGITVATRDVMRLRTLGDIAAYVEENRGKTAAGG